jgi:hypothetical protein
MSGKRGGKGEARGSKVANNQLLQQVFKRGAQDGLFDTIFYDHRGVEAQAPPPAPFMALARGDGLC